MVEFKINKDKMRMAMAAKCLNTTDLAKLAGVNRQTLYNVTNNKCNTSPKTIGMIAKALDVTVEELMGE
jgi:DNA-binding XRE family transcriptional regulator